MQVRFEKDFNADVYYHSNYKSGVPALFFWISNFNRSLGLNVEWRNFNCDSGIRIYPGIMYCNLKTS